MASSVDVEAPDGVADALLAGADGGRRPGVLFLMDAYGLRPAIEQMVDRIAAAGYVVLAPNLFYRAGRSPVTVGMDFQAIRPLIEELTRERIAADGASYLDYLAERASSSRAALTGYCMGGRVGWWIAAAYPDRVAALAAFHTGGLVSEGPESPHLAAGDVEAELLFGFADDDAGMTPEHVATFEQALRDAGARYRADVYEGARHGYTMADLPVFDEDASERHHDELQALLERAFD